MNDFPSSSAQSLINWALGIFASLLGLLFGISGWWARRYIEKIDAIEKSFHTYATQQQMVVVETRMAGLVSRKEFLAYIKQFSDDSERKHRENMDRLDRNHDDIRESREDTRALHSRIDELFSK